MRIKVYVKEAYDKLFMEWGIKKMLKYKEIMKKAASDKTLVNLVREDTYKTSSLATKIWQLIVSVALLVGGIYLFLTDLKIVRDLLDLSEFESQFGEYFKYLPLLLSVFGLFMLFTAISQLTRKTKIQVYENGIAISYKPGEEVNYFYENFVKMYELVLKQRNGFLTKRTQYLVIKEEGLYETRLYMKGCPKAIDAIYESFDKFQDKKISSLNNTTINEVEFKFGQSLKLKDGVFTIKTLTKSQEVPLGDVVEIIADDTYSAEIKYLVDGKQKSFSLSDDDYINGRALKAIGEKFIKSSL